MTEQRMVDALLDAAFRMLQHDTGPQDKEYLFQRKVLSEAFNRVLRAAAPAGEQNVIKRLERENAELKSRIK